MNANDSAFPQHGWSGNPETIAHMSTRQGLTKREHMATELLAGILANPDISKAAVDQRVSPPDFRYSVVLAAISTADALIAGLNNVTQSCTCGEPHISDRIEHCYDGKACYVKEPCQPHT